MEKTVDLKNKVQDKNGAVSTITFPFYEGDEEPTVIEVSHPSFNNVALVVKFATDIVSPFADTNSGMVGFATNIAADFCSFIAISEFLTNAELPDNIDEQWFIYKESNYREALLSALSDCYGDIVDSVKSNICGLIKKSEKSNASSETDKALGAFLSSINEKVEDVSFEELTKMLGGVAGKEELPDVEK